MYYYNWDITTRGYKLTTQTGRFIANEIRPVFAPELSLTGLGKHFEYDKQETRPLLWAQKNEYLLNGEKVMQLNNTQYGKPLLPEFFFEGKLKLEPVNITAMVTANAAIMDIIVADAKRRTKELYDADIGRCDIAYIAFSGGKDSVALLDICHRVLPLSVPVIFSDTDMELPDTYKVWDEIKSRYHDREFICAKAESSALENWRRFAPPSRTIRWCCSVHKSTPALMLLKDKLHKPAIKAMAFVGVRGDESYSRSFYEDATDGVKNASQLNCMPILDWGAHELWLYIFTNDLLINCAYMRGLPRVGCLMCPESSEKYVWFVDKSYPRFLKPYKDIIIETSNKNFKTVADKIEFIGSLNWQARNSGVVLKETLANPFEEHNDLSITFQSPYFTKDLFYEWIKTLGVVVKERKTDWKQLKLPDTLDNGIPFSYNVPHTGGGTAIFNFRDINEKRTILPLLKAFMKKVSACIACRSCEAECSHGAITVDNGKLKIDAAKCTKCRKCYDIDNSCWRFMSMRIPEKSQSAMVSINNYKNFGLRERDQYLWVSTLVDLRDKFFPWHDNHPLGNKMVESARNWFIQSALIHESNKKPTLLVELFRKYGGNSSLGWEFIWINLANNAILLKWFITATEIDKTYTVEQLSEMLGDSNSSLGKSTIDGGLAALKDMLTKSPLGGENAVTLPLMKGRIVKHITRKAKEVDPLTILYGLYLIADKTGRGSFTIRELLTADETSVYVSPIVAFGISPDTFKKQCEGLKSKYPDYIETTFTHGNDELTVFPKEHSIKDIITLALEG
jgi:3'-phosphoadenosine 5'-phosphosulfate sulfotransferase (PAPS reductase)/FAD synthetase/ferredoxin